MTMNTRFIEIIKSALENNVNISDALRDYLEEKGSHLTQGEIERIAQRGLAEIKNGAQS